MGKMSKWRKEQQGAVTSSAVKQADVRRPSETMEEATRDSCYRRRFESTASGSRVIDGVSFTSVPQLCAAYEYALETLRRMYAITDRKQHAFQSEQDVMAAARSLLLAAGKDVE